MSERTSIALERKAVRIQEFADMLGISRGTVYNMIWAGELRTVHVHGVRLIPITEADRLLAATND
jgi:excisionase family DNA binding protein